MPLTTRFGFANAPTSAILGDGSLAWTTLGAGLLPSATAVTVVNASTFPSAVEFDVLVGLRNATTGLWTNAELLHVTVTAGTAWTVTRSDPTFTHASGESVSHVLTAEGVTNSPGVMTDAGDWQYLGANGRPARLAAPADGSYGLTWASGVPAWSLLAAFDIHNITVTATPGDYTLAKSGIVVRNVAGDEVFRIWGTDPDYTNNYNSQNLYIGWKAGNAQLTTNTGNEGYGNVGIGPGALIALTEGNINVAVGFRTLDSLTTGQYNVGIGNSVLSGLVTGSQNTAVGSYGALVRATGDNNTALGYEAGILLAAGTLNTFVGAFSGCLSEGSHDPYNFDNVTCLGANTLVSGSNRAVIGNASVTDVYFGSESGAATLHAAGGFIGPGAAALPALLQGYVGDSALLITSPTASQGLGIEAVGLQGFFTAVQGRPSNAVYGFGADVYAGGNGHEAVGGWLYVSSEGFTLSRVAGLQIYAIAGDLAPVATGLDIENVTGATTNYAIKTALGKVWFGDTVTAPDFILSGGGTLATQSYVTGLGYTTLAAVAAVGYATATSATAFTNKTGNISQWTNDSAFTTLAAVAGVGYTTLAAVNAQTLAVFAATTSLQLKGVIADETGSGALVFATSPSLVTPVLGVASATSLAASSFLSSTQSINATSTDGLLLANTTPATVGAQQWSPRLHFTGQGWKTTATAASQTIDWILEARPVQGTTSPSSQLVFSSAVNGGAYTAQMTIDTAGFNISTPNNVTMVSCELASSGRVGWNTGDLVLARDAADTLAQRRSTNAQTFNLYNTYTDASNYERLAITWSAISNVICLIPQSAGTGTARSFRLYTNNQGSPALDIPSTAGATVLIGNNAATAYSTGRVSLGRDTNTPTTATSGTHFTAMVRDAFSPTATSTLVACGLGITPVVNFSAGTPGAGSYEALKIAVTETALPTGTNYLIRASAGSGGATDKFTVKNDGTIRGLSLYTNATANITGVTFFNDNVEIMSNNAAVGWANTSGYTVHNSGALAWSSTGNAYDSADVLLRRDAAQTLGLRNATSAQKFRVYNTFTTVNTAGEWFDIDWITTANTCIVSTRAGSSTGTLRGMLLGASALVPLALFGATPIVQPTTAIASATFVGGGGAATNVGDTFDGYTLPQVVKALRNLGLLA